MKIQMIDDWKRAWRWGSVRLAAFVVVAPEAIYRMALAFGDVMPLLSSTVVDNLPPWLRGALAIGGAYATYLRLTKRVAPEAAPPAQDAAP